MLLHQAFVRCKPDDDNITITLTLAGRQRNLNRQAGFDWIEAAAHLATCTASTAARLSAPRTSQQ